MLFSNIGYRVGGTVVIGFIWVAVGNALTACDGWTLVRNPADCLVRSASTLRNRIECVERFGVASQLSRQLERSTCDLRDAIKCNRDWDVILCRYRAVKQDFSRLCAVIDRSCDLRRDRRVGAELVIFNQALCEFETTLGVLIRNSQVPFAFPRGGSSYFDQPSNHWFDQPTIHGGRPDPRAWDAYRTNSGFSNGYPVRTDLNPRSPSSNGNQRVHPTFRTSYDRSVGQDDLGEELLKLLLTRLASNGRN